MSDLASFVLNIARNPEDTSARAVFADWLEDGRDPARAEFVRVQTELAAPKLPKARREALEAREQALLDAHRQRWIVAVGVPLTDVTFAGGVITAARPVTWDGGRLLEAPELAALSELDLSDLHLGDAGLATFAAKAQLPALRRLLLSGNDLTDQGALALAAAAGVPRLEYVTLFDNAVTGAGLSALDQAPQLAIAHVDAGEADDGYALNPAQADTERRRYVRERVWPIVAKHFAQHDKLRSAMLCVAQYWADEAIDAVHGYIVLSEREEPTLVGVVSYPEGDHQDPNLPNTTIKPQYGDGSSSAHYVSWDSNGWAISVWSAFAEGEGSQEYETLAEVYTPAVLFHRHGGHRFYPMLRRHLDGVRPEEMED